VTPNLDRDYVQWTLQGEFSNSLIQVTRGRALKVKTAVGAPGTGAVRPPLFSAAANGHLKVCGDALFVCLCVWLCLEGCFVLRFSVCFVFVEIDRLLEKVMC